MQGLEIQPCRMSELTVHSAMVETVDLHYVVFTTKKWGRVKVRGDLLRLASTESQLKPWEKTTLPHLTDGSGGLSCSPHGAGAHTVQEPMALRHPCVCPCRQSDASQNTYIQQVRRGKFPYGIYCFCKPKMN